jgi:plastocyanin
MRPRRSVGTARLLVPHRDERVSTAGPQGRRQSWARRSVRVVPGPSYTFTEPGRYLVICTFFPHFNVGMYGWVVVRAR